MTHHNIGLNGCFIAAAFTLLNNNPTTRFLFIKSRIIYELLYRQIGPSNCSVLFFSRPRSEGWPHHGRTFSIYLRPLSFWLTLPRRVLSTSWCCPSRPCVAFLACVHLALFTAFSLSPGNSLVSSWCGVTEQLQRTITKKQSNWQKSHITTKHRPFNHINQVAPIGKTNQDFTESSDSEWKRHQLGHMQVCTLLQTDNSASNPSRSFLQAGCPSCHLINSVRTLKAFEI